MDEQEINNFVTRLNQEGIITDPQRLREEMERQFGEAPPNPVINYQPPRVDRPDQPSPNIDWFRPIRPPITIPELPGGLPSGKGDISGRIDESQVSGEPELNGIKWIDKEMISTSQS